jgi:hypothetical protein
MTTETTPPQPEMGSAPDNGQASQAPTQGHRRRRRRRKNRSSQQNAQPGQQPQMQQPQQAQPQPQQQAALPPQQKQGQQHHNNNQPRKKKKFFQKGSSPQPQPGNSIGGPAHGKRKGKQRGPREFVGPMDHSYRVANGNVSDGPPSTIQMMSNHNGGGGHYQDAYASPAAPVRENAPTRIFCFIEDLFFQAKISETARKLGIKVEFIKGDKDSTARILEMPEGERPALLVFDLNNLNAKPLVLIPKFRAKLKKATSIIGFLSHLQGDLKLKAVEAGCDTVMPRSAFSQSLPNLLRRYGVEEEEEYAQQPM